MKTRSVLVGIVVVWATLSSVDILTARHMKDVWWGHGDGSVDDVRGASMYYLGETVGALEAALDGYYWRGYDVYELEAIMDELTGLAREIAFTFVNERLVAIAAGAEMGGIDEAKQFLVEGDERRIARAYSAAVESYTEALYRAKANRRSTVKAQDL